MTLSKPVIITALVLIAMALTVTTYGAITVSKNLSSTGSINTSPNLGVYSDYGCTSTLSSIDWGTITPGTTVTRPIYVKNTGSGTSLSLSMTTSNWSPTSANGPITINWDKQGTILSPGQSTAAVITLTASSSISGITTFSVQISITGTA